MFSAKNMGWWGEMECRYLLRKGAKQEDVAQGELYHMLNHDSVLHQLEVYEECGDRNCRRFDLFMS